VLPRPDRRAELRRVVGILDLLILLGVNVLSVDRIDFCNEYRPWETGEPLQYGDLFDK